MSAPANDAWLSRLRRISEQHANDPNAELAANVIACTDRLVAEAIREYRTGGRSLREQGYTEIADVLSADNN